MQTPAMIHLGHCGTKATPDNTWIKGCGWVPRKLHLWKEAVGWIWPVGPEVGSPGLKTHPPVASFWSLWKWSACSHV